MTDVQTGIDYPQKYGMIIASERDSTVGRKPVRKDSFMPCPMP
jgi:hypothetical protein